MRPLRPRDFVESDGVLAAVTSVLHPEGPVVTPRYLREGDRLVKLDAATAHATVQRRHADWLLASPLLGVEVVLIPRAEIERYHLPEDRAAALLRGAAASPVEERAAAILAALVEGGVPAGRLGLTGSLLVGAAGADSDVDVVVHGRAAFVAARAALAALVQRGRWHAPDDAHWRDAWMRRGAPGTLSGYRAHEHRKGTKAVVDGARVDLALLQEVGEGEAEHPPFRKLRRLTIEATVTDASGAFDYPARYRVQHEDVEEIVAYTATYAGQALAGERVTARGWLELDARGMRRLLVGTSREAPGESLAARDLGA